MLPPDGTFSERRASCCKASNGKSTHEKKQASKEKIAMKKCSAHVR